VKIEVTEAAWEDLAEATEFYEARLPGLGRDFLLEVERLAAVLLASPTLGEKLDPAHRRLSLRRFPYGLIFKRDGEVIRVVAVAHRRRSSRYWSFRVQDRAMAARIAQPAPVNTATA
jgi:plasmid stabilization system protein ParE